MVLQKLSLKNFRNYSTAEFKFSQNTTILLGPNTSGKTNILEAITVLAIGKSFRAGLEREMIKWGNQLSVVNCQLSEENETKELEMMLTTGEVGGQKAPVKKYLINGVSKRLIDFIGNLRVVLFWPEDLELITDSPSLRRKYLDFVLVQVDREYRRCLLSYERGLRQRNKILEKIKDGQAYRSQLMFWDQLLIKTGNYLTSQRQRFIEAINLSSKPFGDFNIAYDASFISGPRLKQYEQEEVAACATLVGPHRDDLQFFENKRDLSKFGSRGEQRLAILWLKLAELEFIEKQTNQKPLLLLDDIFSELDDQHKLDILKITGNQQTLIAATDLHFLPKTTISDIDVIKLGYENG